MKIYEIKTSQFIKRPLAEVFEFFSRPENLAQVTPAKLHFRILTPQPLEMKQGAVIDYTIKLFKIFVHWRTLITAFEPPYRFVDEQIKGPYSYWHHNHIFKEVNGGVEIQDTVSYSIPFGLLGKLLHAVWIKRDLEGIFEYRKNVIDRIFSRNTDNSQLSHSKKVSLA